IVVDKDTDAYLKEKNGTKIVNIATPTKKGVSHSKFKDFSVDKNGAVINNKYEDSRSELINDTVEGNKNLKEGVAKVALFDVTGQNKSELKGTIEALSKNDLSVILSNENGITVDGANFINIHNMTLTTSKVKDNDGKLEYSKL
ncbi:two-partner secretion domain-containing protein, partial [Oceanivirga salmonicida]|uniref:two-partner secretion domain-containing protein n=1 Tax=Oceanivirga salmonicida TaxID=1769291 RepID=UPI0018D244F8